MILSVTVLCDPPLGQSTVVPHDQDAIALHVVLQSNAALPTSTTEVVLWHNAHDDAQWAGLPLSKSSARSPLRSLSAQDSRPHYAHFSGVVRRPWPGLGAYEFTLKYRTHAPTAAPAADDGWIWASALAPSANGELIFQTPFLPATLPPLFSRFDASSSLTVHSTPSEAPDTRLWTLTLPVLAAGASASATASAVLGVPTAVARWTASVRASAAWLAPRHGYGVWRTDAGEDAWTASFWRRDGLHVVLLGVAGVDGTAALLGDDGFGAVVVRAQSDCEERGEAVVLAAVGFEPDAALAACMYRVRRMLEPAAGAVEPGAGAAESADRGPLEEERGGGLRASWMEEWYDGLGYSTWNALGPDLSEERILAALRDLNEHDVKVSNLFIDDGWQSVDTPEYTHASRWSAFEAQKAGFPHGLNETVAKIKETCPSAAHVGVWHALLGYWGGTSPDGAIGAAYPTHIFSKTPTAAIPGAEVTAVAASHAERLYADFYGFLSAAGISAVKADVQCQLDLLSAPSDRRAFFAAYPPATTQATLAALAGRAVACMAHVPALLLRTHLPTARPRALLRTSDDFFPDAPAAAQTWHVFANAHGARWARLLHVVPDWDMFQTGARAWGSFHAAARCLSGGPVVITDAPGAVDGDVVRQVVAPTVAGTRVALRPSAGGRVAAGSVYVAHGAPRLLRVGAYHGAAATGASFLGVFNVGDGPLAELVLLRDFPGVMEGSAYVVRGYTGGSLAEPMTAGAGAVPLPLSLDEGSWEIFTAYPVTNVGAEDNVKRSGPGPQVAVLGLVDKMTGAAAVLGTKVEVERQRLRVATTLKALGKLGLFHEKHHCSYKRTLTQRRRVLFRYGTSRHWRGRAHHDSWIRDPPDHRVCTRQGTRGRRGAGVARDAARAGICQRAYRGHIHQLIKH